MSYILDALKRADAERGRGVVPGLHARHLPEASAQPAVSHFSHFLPWLGGALLLAALATFGWVGRSPHVPAASMGADSTAAQANLPDANLPNPVNPVNPPGPTPALSAAPTPAPATAQSQAPAPAPAPAQTASGPELSAAGPKPAPRPVQPTSNVEPLSGATSAPAAPPSALSLPATSKPATSDPPAAPPIDAPLLTDLPEELRRQIPALVITGSVHASNPAQRLLVVNNQVLTQDGQLTPDLVLESIGLRHSVFSFRGTRFRVPNQ